MISNVAKYFDILTIICTFHIIILIAQRNYFQISI